jgi:hypothetical protein
MTAPLPVDTLGTIGFEPVLTVGARQGHTVSLGMDWNGSHRNGVTYSFIQTGGVMLESTLRRIARREGFRIEENDDGYTLIDDRLNAIMYHYKDVTLDEIAKFLAPSDE